MLIRAGVSQKEFKEFRQEVNERLDRLEHNMGLLVRNLLSEEEQEKAQWPEGQKPLAETGIRQVTAEGRRQALLEEQAQA